MQTNDKTVPGARLALWGAQAVAVVLGLRYGYAFGQEISGPVLGVVLAVNTAIFGAMGVTALVDLTQRLRAAGARRR